MYSDSMSHFRPRVQEDFGSLPAGHLLSGRPAPVLFKPPVERCQPRIFLPHSRDVDFVTVVFKPSVHYGHLVSGLLFELIPGNLLVPHFAA
jgi:hypothetical protein